MPVPPNMTGPNPSGVATDPEQDAAYEALRRAYQQFLGRLPSQQELDGWLSADFSPGNVQRIISLIERSPEATTYAKAQTAAATTEIAKADPFQTRPQPGDFSRVEGYDARNWGTMNSLKYRAGEILARYPATPEGLKQAVNDPDFKRLFPNATLEGHDTINFNGQLSDFDRGVPVYSVDVGLAFDTRDNTGRAWGWRDPGNEAKGSQSAGGASTNWVYRAPTIGTGTTTPTTPSPIAPVPDVPSPDTTTPPTGLSMQAFSRGRPAPTQAGAAPMSTFAQQYRAPVAARERIIPGDIYMSELIKQRDARLGPQWRLG